MSLGRGFRLCAGCASMGMGGWAGAAGPGRPRLRGHTLHPPSPPPFPSTSPSGTADLRQPWGGARKKTHKKTTAPGGQMASKTFLLNFPVKQKQYSCPLELGGGSDSAGEGLCVQHTHTHTHTAEHKTSGSSHSSGCLDALSPCHSLGSQPGGRSLEQAWGLEPETLLCYGTVHLIHQPSLTRLWAQAQGFSRAWPSQFFLSSSLRAQPPL